MCNTIGLHKRAIIQRVNEKKKIRLKGTVIRATEFHPSAAVALVAGLNGAASLIRVDGKDNPKMQG